MARPGLVLVVGLALACGSKQAGSDGPTPASQIDAGSADSTSNQAPEPTRAVALANRVEALVGRLGKPILELEDAPTALSVGVVAKGEEHYVGLGHLSEGGPAPGSDTLFHVASLTKPHTSLLVAQLVIEGKLKLDDPLPWCRRGRPRALCGKPKTTIRHLLTHSSGLRIVPSDGGGDYSPAKLRRYLARTRPPDRTPGQRFRYSTTGYGVLALRLEELGKPYLQLLSERVLLPIGSRAVVELDESTAARLAPGFNRAGNQVPAGPTREAFVASGGLIASARDLVKLLALFVEPERHPSLEKAVRLTRTRNDELVGFHGSAVAFGWMVDRDTGIHWHPGVSSVHRTVIAYHPDERIGVAVLVNRYRKVSDERLEKLAFELIAQLPAILAEKH